MILLKYHNRGHPERSQTLSYGISKTTSEGDQTLIID